MFCRNCGREAAPGSAFCTACGATLRTRVNESPSVVTAVGAPAGWPNPAASTLAAPSRAHYWWVLLGAVGGVVGWLLVRERNRSMALRILVMGIVVTAVSLAGSLATVFYLNAAAHRISAAYPVTSPSVAPSSVPTTTPPSQVGVGSPTWTIDLTSPSGAAATATLQLGTVEPFQNGLVNGALTAGTACQFTPNVDGVIPAVLTLTNGPSNSAMVVGVDIQGIGSGSSGQLLTWEAQYTGGPQCTGQNDGSYDVNVYSTNPLSAGSSSTTDAFIGVLGLYGGTSLNPSSVLSQEVLTVPSTFQVGGTGGTYSVTDVTGPGVTPVAMGWQFTLALAASG